MAHELAQIDVTARVQTDGKLLRLGGEKFYVKGFSYGPFSLNSQGDYLPERSRMLHDFSHMCQLGANTIRLYQVPSGEVLDDLLEAGLKVLIDVPWEKHRCFFEDWSAKEAARGHVQSAAQLAAAHPAILAISVVNELPNDVVRFYGHGAIEEFIEELGDSVKQIAPECLTTFANYPTTEFLQPGGFDFLCYNVYLHNIDRLSAYLTRLQHIAGDQPLVLGEFGVDSHSEGESSQARILGAHVAAIFQHGLAGSIVFSYTDDWFTGGHQVEDWGFGVTTAERQEKPAARALQEAWQHVPFAREKELPKVSVVVCAYNAASTLRECLGSLSRIDYADYEVILVDDGSEDETPQIAAEFPQVIYIRQSNHGLSHARNVGAERATSEIIAYTDADCVADEDWLRCLIQAMISQGVDAIGGPNITPHTDGWSAQCVAASPGNPSHVMLDDCRAEHIPGCNMAFRREALAKLGGFDPQFRAAGDDVDLCWRLLDHGGSIGYAPGGFVWHHRRETVKAFLKQQIGYGRAEAMLHFMHPQRFSMVGRCSWHGRIYGSGAAGLPLVPERIYYGPFGYAPFQVVYRHNAYGIWACVTWLEWHLLAFFFLALGFLFWPLLLISVVMWSTTAAFAVRAAREASLPSGAPWWCRWLVGGLHILQPVVREWCRVTYDLRMWRPSLSRRYLNVDHRSREIRSCVRDLYWSSSAGIGREQLLIRIVEEARHHKWLGVFSNAWAAWDVKLVGDLWHTICIHTVTEELGKNRRFTRARLVAQATLVNRVASVAALVWTVAALGSLDTVALAIALGAAGLALLQNIRSRRSCLEAASALVARAGQQAGLKPCDAEGRASQTAQEAIDVRGCPPQAPTPEFISS